MADRLSAWTSVKVNNPKHPRADQAGTVQGYDGENPLVKFDLDGVTEVVPQDNLLVLR